MTHKKIFFMPFLVLFLFTNILLPVSAMNTGLETEELAQEDFEEAVQTITLLDKVPEKLNIDSFDVNEKGMVAIKFSDGFAANRYVGIYDEDGNYQYGYLLGTNSTVEIEWDGDNLIVYFVRPSLVYSVNSCAEVQCLLKVTDASKNGSYRFNKMRAKEKAMGDLEYRITNAPRILNLVAESYSQLVVKNADGEETVLYDAFENGHDMTLREGLVYAGLVIVGLVIVLVGATKKFRERNGEGDDMELDEK